MIAQVCGCSQADRSRWGWHSGERRQPESYVQLVAALA